MFGPKKGHVFQNNTESPLLEAPSSSQRAQGNKRLIVISQGYTLNGRLPNSPLNLLLSLRRNFLDAQLSSK